MQKIGFCDKYSLTQAVLNGTKPMTRRVEKGLETFEFDYEVHFAHSLEIINQYWDEEKNSLAIITPQGKMKVPTRYKLGEVVAVAQAYKDAGIDPHYLMFATVKEKFSCVEKEIEAMFTKGWSNKMFVRPDLMPHQIKISDIKIERLQDISDEDCLKEGIVKFDYGFFVPNLYRIPSRGVLYSYKTPREAFATLIDKRGVGRPGLWVLNPWVVVYEFKLVK